jgi:hypothetical protein
MAHQFEIEKWKREFALSAALQAEFGEEKYYVAYMANAPAPVASSQVADEDLPQDEVQLRALWDSAQTGPRLRDEFDGFDVLLSYTQNRHRTRNCGRSQPVSAAVSVKPDPVDALLQRERDPTIAALLRQNKELRAQWNTLPDEDRRYPHLRQYEQQFARGAAQESPTTCQGSERMTTEDLAQAIGVPTAVLMSDEGRRVLADSFSWLCGKGLQEWPQARVMPILQDPARLAALREQLSTCAA